MEPEYMFMNKFFNQLESDSRYYQELVTNRILFHNTNFTKRVVNVKKKSRNRSRNKSARMSRRKNK